MVDWHSPAQLARDARMSVSRLPDRRIVNHSAEAFSNLIHVLFGLYLWASLVPCIRLLICQFSWEFCVSFQFDLSFISGKRKFRWPMVSVSSFLHVLRSFPSYVYRQTFYFAGRYCLLAALIGMWVPSSHRFALLAHCNGFTSALSRLMPNRACSRSLSVHFNSCARIQRAELPGFVYL